MRRHSTPTRLPMRQRGLGSDLDKVDATTEEDIARHMLEDDTPEWTDAQFAECWIGDPPGHPWRRKGESAMSRSGRAYHLLCRIPLRGSWRLRLHRKVRSRRHTPLRQMLIRHQTATLRRGWR